MATIPKKKPRNQMELAKLIADIATGEEQGKELTLKEAKFVPLDGIAESRRSKTNKLTTASKAKSSRQS